METQFPRILSNLVPQCLRASWKAAFTLAETLIVIGIIGVVAALTLPNLNHATGDKEKVTKVKKIYSALTDAVDRAQVIYGPCDEWTNDIAGDNAAISERFAKRITEFMKVSKDCGHDEGCWSDGYFIGFNGNPDGIHMNWLNEVKAYMVTLSDGMSLAIHHSNNEWSFIEVKVDIDGPNKGKTQYGNDIFDFVIGLDSENCKGDTFCKLNELTPDGPSGGYLWSGCGYSLTTWVIENGNLDYLKATEGEDGLECPNGKTLDWTTNTSCN